MYLRFAISQRSPLSVHKRPALTPPPNPVGATLVVARPIPRSHATPTKSTQPPYPHEFPLRFPLQLFDPTEICYIYLYLNILDLMNQQSEERPDA